MTFAKNTETTIIDFYSPLTGMRAIEGDFGLEIEFEGEMLTGVPVKGWRPHADNSLRGAKGVGPGGMEYTTNGAIPQAQVLPAVVLLRDTLIKSGATFRDDSPRTSVHIHHNVQRMSWIEVFGYITVFAAVEPLFLHLCGPRRDGNSFCTNSFDTGDLPDWFADVFKQLENWKGEAMELHGRGKYASLGTFRLHDLGTLEARCFPFSIDPEQINTWCTWLGNIKSVVQQQSDKSMRGLIKTGIHEPMTLARSIFGDIDISRYLAEELIQFGSREAYELTRLLKFYLNKKPDEKKSRTKKFTLDEMVEQMAPMPDWNDAPQAVGLGVGAAPRPRRWGD